MIELAFHSLHYSPMLGGHRPLLEVVEASASAGFSALGFDQPAIDDYRACGGTLQTLAAALDAYGMRCCDVMVLSVADEPSLVREASRLAEVAEVLGAPLCVASVMTPRSWKSLCKILDSAACVLYARGVRLAIEFMPHTPLKSLAMAAQLCDALGWERAGLVLDSFHFYQAQTPIDQLRALQAHQIALVQCSDAATTCPSDVANESRNHRLLPGAGVLPLAEWSSALLGVGYEGPVVAEVLSEDVRRSTPHEFVKTARRALSQQWGIA